ncbi:MAG: M23 family metallopeptidase [Bacteroidota bacterium]
MMPTERDHHITKDKSFWIVLIPRGDSGSTRSYKASVLTIVLVCFGVVLCIVAATVAAIVYTPAGLLIPMSDEQLQERYGSKLFEVQQRLNRVTSEVLVLREYNNKLRKALGQQELPADSIIQFNAVDKALTQAPEQSTQEPSVQPLLQDAAVVYRSASGVQQEATFRAEFPLLVPATGFVSRKFEAERGHVGIDFAGKIGSLVVAAAEGYVVFAGYTVDDGYTMILSHGGGFLTIYKHNQSLLKTIGEMVKRGEPIALLGNTGRISYGPHLHFEVWKNGQAQNPSDYFIASEL